MKKIISLILCLILVLGLAACGSKNEEGGKDTPKATKDSFSFKVKDTVIHIGDDMAAVLKALGDPVSYFESPSCAFAGLDKIYTYSGFTVSTSPKDKKDIVTSIELTDDSVTTFDGLYIGSSADDVKKIYGKSSSDLDVLLSYENGSVSVEFGVKDGKVKSISYVSNEKTN